MIEAQQPLPGSLLTALKRLLDPRPYLQAFRELGVLFVNQRVLTLEMAKRELSSEHSGKKGGRFWGVFQPLFLLAVYAFIYTIVFKTRIPAATQLQGNFTIYILAGLVPWFAFQFAMAKGASLISGNATLVKQFVFDLNILPVATGLASCLSLGLGLAFIVTYTVVTTHGVPVTYVLLPILVVLQFLAMTGVVFLLSALGAFIQDVRDVVQLSAIVLIFLMPIVYLPSQVPAAFDPVLWFNPFSYMIWCYQDTLYFGGIAHHAAWVIFPAWSLFLFVGGYRVFRRVRPFFGNVL